MAAAGAVPGRDDVAARVRRPDEPAGAGAADARDRTADDWFDVQLDRRRVRADVVREHGNGLFTVKLMTSVRTQTAAFRRKDDAVVLARALGAPC